MSCNGCRVLRKGCTDKCILRPCLQWIDSPQSQAHATLFLAKFFGRAGLMSFISSVPETQRPSLFQSLLFEAAGRTVNPVNGAVGLLWTGNWHVCQASVDTVLQGGTLRPMTDAFDGFPMMPKVGELGNQVEDLVGSKMVRLEDLLPVVHGSGSPSMNSEESSVTVTCLEGGLGDYGCGQGGREFQLLNLFN